jgi:hypothetical protein
MINSDPINVTITLDTEIGDCEIDPETGDRVGPGATILDLVVAQAVTKLIPSIREDVAAAVTAAAQREITDQVSVMVTEVLAEPFQTTDRWGDLKGKPVTIRERIAEEIAAQLKPAKSDPYNRSTSSTVVTDVIKEEVRDALNKELKATVQAARERVVGAVKDHAATLIADSVRAGLKQ